MKLKKKGVRKEQYALLLSSNEALKAKEYARFSNVIIVVTQKKEDMLSVCNRKKEAL